MMHVALQAARVRAFRSHPYFSAALWALTCVEQQGLGTLAVDKHWRLYYDPAVFDKWSVDEVAGVLIHEIGHLLRDHFSRAIEIAAEASSRWNIAADCAINGELQSQVKLPAGGILPKDFSLPDGLAAEEYYRRLSSEQGQSQGQSQGQGQGQDDGKEGHSSSHQPAPCAGRCGSCATGRAEEYELPPPDGSSDVPGVSAAESRLIQREVAHAIRQHTQAQGKLPAGWQRWAEEVLKPPKVNWQRLLAQVVRGGIAQAAGKVDYSYRRPSRRQSAVPQVVLTTMYMPLPEVSCIIDTSGSMSDGMIAQAAAEVGGILRALGMSQVTVYSCDAAVHNCQRVFRAKDVKLTGGGGTDLTPAIVAAEAQRPRPQVLIIVTDGYLRWRNAPPKGMVAVTVLAGGGQPPQWGKVIRI